MLNYEELDKKLQEAAPIKGWGVKGGIVRINFMDEATKEQRLAAEKLAREFKFSERVKEPPLTDDEIRWVRAQMAVSK